MQIFDWTAESVAAEAAKYTTITEFCNESPSAHDYAVTHDLLESICAHMPSPGRGRKALWTKDACALEAKKYSSRVEFMRGTPSAYMASYKKKWMDEFFPVTIVTWTVETLLAEAMKYKTRTEFQKGSAWAYRIARKNNVIDTICAHMIVCEQVKWSKEACAEEAKKYTKRSQFMYGCKGAYKTSCRNGWIEEFFPSKKTFMAKEYVAAEAAKYTTRSEFRAGSPQIYNFARKHNLLDEVCSHMASSVPKKVWSKELCAEEAKRYKSRTDFYMGSSAAYAASCQNKWMDEFFPRKVPEWTVESLAAHAANYASRTEFFKGSSWAYAIARKNGLLDIVCSHMVVGGSRLKWTKENSAKEAAKYASRSLFRKGSRGAYKASCKNKWIDEFFPRREEKWTVEQLAAEAGKYTSRSAFQKGCAWAHRIARKNNLLDTICGHMIDPDQLRWTKEACAEEAKKYTKRTAFKYGSFGAYRAARLQNWLDDFFPSRKIVWTVEQLAAEAAKYTFRSDFYKGSGWAYRIARANNLLDSICSHMPGGGSRLKWTKEACAEEALKYATRSAFGKGSLSAYRAALFHNWIEEFFPVITQYWTFESLVAEAAKYKSKKEFMRMSSSAYSFAVSHDVLETICAHMPPRGRMRIWTQESCAREAKKYKTRSAFSKGSLSAYQASVRFKWIDGFYPKF